MQPIIYGLDMWRLSTLFGALACTWVLIARSPWTPITRWVAAYFSIISVWAIFYMPIGSENALTLAKRVGASRMWFAVLLTPLIASTLSDRWRPKVRVAFFFALVLNAVYRAWYGGSVWIGTTQDNIVLTIFVPYFWRHYGVYNLLLLMPLVSGVLAETGIWVRPFAETGQGSIVIVALYVIAQMIRAKDHDWKWIGGGALLVGVLFLWNQFETFSFRIHRYEIWREFIVYWKANANPLWGTGPGSFEWLSITQGFGHRWTWMHGDWAQLIFEHGWIGFSVAVLFYLYLLWRCRQVYYKFITLIAMGIGMLVYSPMQFFWAQFLMVMIVTERGVKDDRTDQR